jgi:hypothetical protein
MSVAEATDPQDPRCVRIFSKKEEHTRVEDVLIPEVIRYSSVRYPGPIIRPDDMMTYVYRVDDCRSLTRAKAHYPNEYIYAVEKKKPDPAEVKTGEKARRFENKWDALTDMMRETGQVINRKVHGYLKELLM